MPRRKRARRHRKHNLRNHFEGSGEFTYQDDPMRTYTVGKAPSTLVAKISKEFGFKTDRRTPSPSLEEPDPRSHCSLETPKTPIRKRRSPSRENFTGTSALRHMFNLSEKSADSFITDLRTCQSSTILETHSRPKVRSSSSMAKLHSPGVEKVPLKAATATQTHDVALTETPQMNHDSLLDLDFNINLARRTPLSGYQTPLKRMRMSDNLTPIFDLKDTAMCIQDLNNLQNEYSGHKALNCSRALSGDSLKRLQNFNELILNTSQKVDYDNCEPPSELEENLEVAGNEVQDGNYDVSAEISFFTPQLYNGKSASTPIEKQDAPPKVLKRSKVAENNIETVKNESIERKALDEKLNASASTSAHVRDVHNVAIQTSFKEVKCSRIKSKEKLCFVTKRRSYKSLTPTVVCCRTSPKRDLKYSSSARVSLEKSDSAETIATIETCAKLIAKIKKYHGNYSAKLPAKIMEICTWLGLAIKKGVTSLYKLYAQQKTLNESTNELNCKTCNLYRTQISALTSTVDELRSEMNYMKQEYKEKTEKLSSLYSEVDQLRRDLSQFQGLRSEIAEIKTKLAEKPIMLAPVPPAPPPPPPLPVAVSSNVKDRSSPLQRRSTEPLIQSTVLKQVKLKPTCSRPQTPSSNGSHSGTSSLSNSPCSSLTRLLTNVDSNEKSS